MKKRNLFTKENFLEGNRQKWVFIFLFFMMSIMILDALQLIKDPVPYLTFLTFLAGSFILGYSGTSMMQLFRVNSSTQNINENVEQNETSSVNEKKDVNIKQEILSNNAKENDYNITENQI
jgi:hypothetical protein